MGVWETENREISVSTRLFCAPVPKALSETRYRLTCGQSVPVPKELPRGNYCLNEGGMSAKETPTGCAKHPTNYSLHPDKSKRFVKSIALLCKSN